MSGASPHSSPYARFDHLSFGPRASNPVEAVASSGFGTCFTQDHAIWVGELRELQRATEVGVGQGQRGVSVLLGLGQQFVWMGRPHPRRSRSSWRAARHSWVPSGHLPIPAVVLPVAE